MASTDSALARVETLTVQLPDTLRQIVVALRATVLQERLASDSAISAPSSALALKDVALARAEAVIAAKDRELSAASELISGLRQQASPSGWRRAGAFLRHAAIGAAALAVVMVAR